MKKVIEQVGWFILLCISNLANASPILQIDSNGKLTGAKGVQVGSAIFDVDFVDGTCASVFSVCDPSHFTFNTLTEAQSASKALLDQVLLDTSTLSFDSDPELIYGCPNGFINCIIFTPYNVSVIDAQRVLLEGAEAVNSFINLPLADYVQPANLGLGDDDLSMYGSFTYARWSPSTQVIPEPGTTTSTMAGLFALVIIMYRSKGKKQLV